MSTKRNVLNQSLPKPIRLAVVVFCVVAICNETSLARGFGGGGGGGRSIGGGGSRPSVSRPSVSRPSSPSISRPSSRPSVSRPTTRPSMPSSRPNIPSSRPSTRPSVPSTRPNTPSTRPSTPSTRPNIPTTRPTSPSTRPSIPSTRPNVPSTRPSITPGTRPSTRPGLQPGSRPDIGNRPSTLPSTRPGVIEKPGNRPSTLPEIRPGVVERPSTRPSPGERPGLGNRPGNGDRPTTLPGLGDRPNRPGEGDRPNRPGDGNRPGLGNRPDRPVNRPSFGDRQDLVNDRLNNREDRWNNRQDRWDDRRDRWDDWHHRHYYHHSYWHHGHWHGHWYPGARWNYWWDNYPALTAFGMTTWAVNRVGWAFGYYNYYNPYASAGTVYIDNSSYDYSQPIVMTPDETSLSADPTAEAAVYEIPDSGMDAFEQARSDFYDGKYEEALKSTDAALQEMPNDTVIHEFRALVTFALGKYQDSAATLYAVLSVGPGWDWTTMSSLYPNVEVYSNQLRALEEYCRQNKDDMSCRFVLAYHYTTGGHAEEAGQLYEAIVKQNPKDSVSKQLLLQIDPEYELPNAPEPVKPPQPSVSIDSEQLVGNWKATREDDSFEMNLKEDKSFSWTYANGEDSQKVTGVWGVDEDGVLALEMNDEGAMLAQVIVSGSKLDFYMLGDTQGSDPLNFVKK